MIAENPKITELKPYRTFNIIKIETYSEWSKYVSYEAYRNKCGYITAYISDCESLKEVKEKILLYENEEQRNGL